MAWIELHTVLVRHRKTRKFARALGIPPEHAVGYLVTLWGHVLELQVDGDITKWSVEDIVEYAGWKGAYADAHADAHAFYCALVNGGDGFIDERDGKRYIHDWWNYTQHYLISKLRTSNPEELVRIKSIYNQTVDSLKTAHQPNLPNQPTYIYTATFENLWLKFPNKVGKKMSQRSFQNTVKTDEDVSLITKALDNYLGSRRVADGYIQNASTWFNNWRDWIEQPDARDNQPDILKKWGKK